MLVHIDRAMASMHNERGCTSLRESPLYFYCVFGETDKAEMAEESRFTFSSFGVRMAGDNVGPCSKGASVVN